MGTQSTGHEVFVNARGRTVLFYRKQDSNVFRFPLHVLKTVCRKNQIFIYTG